MKKKWYILIVVVLIAIVGAYNYLFQDHRDIAKEEAQYTLTTKAILDEFAINAEASEKKYLNKTIQVKGEVSQTTTKNITIDNTVFCQFTDILRQVPANAAHITIKGRFIGYDDLVEEIKLDQCTIINTN